MKKIVTVYDLLKLVCSIATNCKDDAEVIISDRFNGYELSADYTINERDNSVVLNIHKRSSSDER